MEYFLKMTTPNYENNGCYIFVMEVLIDLFIAHNVKRDLHSCIAKRSVWFGVSIRCGNLSFVTGEILCLSSHALIALCSYVKPSPAM